MKRLHEDDLARGYGAVHLPEALERKCPHANEEWAWQYVFPSQRLSVDPSAAKGQRREKPLRWRLALLERAVGARPNEIHACDKDPRTEEPDEVKVSPPVREWRREPALNAVKGGRPPRRP